MSKLRVFVTRFETKVNYDATILLYLFSCLAYTQGP